MSRPWILFAATSILFSVTALSTVNQLMTHYDLTRDGKVDSRELRTVAYMDHKLPPTISDDIFRKADRNGDKFIDRIEIIAAARLVQRHVARATLRWLEDHDTDGDGLLNEAEVFESIYMELGLSTKDVNGCFRESDVNKDRYLTSSELVEMLQCSRLLALKEAKELLKIYDTDGDHRLNIREAQMLASLRYDIEPSYATIIFEDVSHRADHTINELELIDFLTKLREEAAIAALNKLPGLDQNGDEAVSFSELLQGYEKQLKKTVLKKIFSKVDVNKNAHIDPIEFVSLQNLIADEIRLQTIQNDFEQQYSATINATTSLPTLIIFRSSKKSHTHNQQPPKQRKRRSDVETDRKLMVSDESHPGIKELTATNASSVYFSAVVTAVPKFMKSNNEYQKFLSGGVKLIPEMFDDSERPENGDVIEIDDIKKSHENSIFDGNTSPLIQTMIRKDSKFTSAINKGQLESNSRTDGSGYVRNQNEAFTYSPNIAYIKKFEKFFDFLQKTIKKISKAVKEESNEKQEDLKSPLKGINIIKHSGQIRNNTLNTEASETERIASVSENSTSIPTTTGKLKIQGNLDNDIYGRIRNEENMIVHTPIDSSEYNTAVAKKFRGLFGTPFLQLDEKEIVGKVEMINYQKEHEHSFDERNFHGAIEKNEKKSEIMEENGCVLEGQADSSASDDSSEYATRPVKQYKCNIEAQTTTETTIEPFPKTPEKFKKAQLPSESNEEHKNQKKGRRKLEDKLLNKIDNTLEYETTPPLLQDVENEDSLLRKKNKSSTINHKLHSEYNNDETIKIISEEEDDEESDESSDQQSTKHIINPNELSEQKSVNKHAKSTVQPLDSPLTDKHIKIIDSGSDSMGFEKISAKTKGGKLPLQKAVYLDGDKLVNEFEFPVHKQSKQYKVLESNSTFPMEENVTNKYDLELYSRSQMTDPHLSNSQSLPLEQTQLQAIDIKYQTVSNSSEEDEFPDKVLNDMLTTTFSEIDQASTISKVTKFKNHRKKNSQKTTKPLMKLRKNDTVSQIPKISMTLPALPTISPSATTSLTFSSAMDHPTDENINQTSTMSNMVSNAVTHLEDNNDTYDLSVENTEIGKALSDFIPDMERSGRNKVRGEQQHNEEIGLVQKERKECLDGKKCPTEKVSMEEVIPTTNTTDIICGKKKLSFECRLKKNYRSKICSNDRKCISLSRSRETSESIDSPEQDFYQKNKTESLHRSLKMNETSQLQVEDWRKERVEDLLLRAMQEYQAYLKNQEKGMKN